jgi:type II secretory pathway component GspD/PulD (secretin)
MRTRILLLSALLSSAAIVRTYAQTAPATTEATKPADAAPADATVTIKDTETHAGTATKTKDASGRDTLSVDFPDMDVREIIKNVADLFELNIIIPETLQGKTTIKLRDVTWRQIFQNVLAPVGYTYQEDGNIIKIVSNDSLQQEPASTEVFILNYAKASDVLPTVTSLVDAAAGGKIVIDSRTNALVITERPSRMNRIRPILEQLDHATAQVMIETKFVEVTDRDVKNIGVNWASLQNFQVGVGSISQNFTRSRGQTFNDGTNGTSGSSTNTGTTTTGATNTIGGTTTSSTVTSSGSLVTFDPVTNVPTVTAIPPAANTTTTTTTPSTQVSSSSNSNGGSSISSALNSLVGLANNGSTNRTATAVFSASDFNVVLSALQSNNDTKIVSNPTIVTLNNTEATINVGEEFPIPSYSYNEQRGSFEVSNFVYKPIGINLKVTPQVNARGSIKLSVTPEVSQQNGSTTFGGAGGASLPIIATRKVTTQVSLQDGYTMGIGGLIRTQTTNGSTKVPIIGSVPVIGRLFRSDSKNKDTSNLLIFITAKSISAEGAPAEQIFDSRQIRQMNLQREELPGHREKGDPFAPAPEMAK